jgi:HD-like signal output (HDOD) protein/CheY-like chemotaxis protein
MVRVLFVDDEPRVLDALKRQLRPYSDQWEMRFESSAHAAVEMLETWRPDVVVSDLRMPEVDGTKLLAVVAEKLPRAVRVVLTGMVNERSLVEALGVAHQFLAKPIDATAIQKVVERALSLRRWVARPEVASAVERLGSLPALPQVCRRIAECVRRDASLAEIGAVMGEDPGLTARLLQIANSAYFAPRRPITSVALAASFLGLEMVRSIVLLQGLGGSALDAGVQSRMERIWRHSLEVAQASRALAVHERLPRDEATSAFSLGVLHDIGALLLATRRESLEVGDAHHTAEELERARHGFTHAEAGAHLALSWGLPDDAVEVAALHHDPRQFSHPERLTPGFLVSAACAFKDGELVGGEDAAHERLRSALESRGLSDRFDSWSRTVESAAEPAESTR